MKRKTVVAVATVVLGCTVLGFVFMLHQFDCAEHEAQPWGEWVDTEECPTSCGDVRVLILGLAFQHETRDSCVWFELLHVDYWNVRTAGEMMQGLDLLQVGVFKMGRA